MQKISDKVKKAAYISGMVLVLLSALIGLVFAFVCGVSLVTVVEGEESSITSMLYDYFGNAYKDLNETREGILTAFDWKDMGGAREFALYLPTVLGTIISAVGLLGVVALAGLTGYKAYVKFYKKQEANVLAPAVATYLTFATLATLLLVLVSANANETKTVFTAPTFAGIVSGGVLLGLGGLLIAVSNYEKFKGPDVAVGAIAAFAVCAFTAVIIGLFVLPPCNIITSSFIYDQYVPQLVTTQSGTGLFTGLQAMLLSVEDDDRFFKLMAFALMGGVAAVALAVISAVTLFRKVPALTGGKNNGNLILCAVNLGLAVLYLTFSVLFTNEMIDEDITLIAKDFTAPIVILEMAALAFAAELASKLIVKVKKQEAPVEVPSETPAE